MTQTPKQALDLLAAILIDKSGIPCTKFSAATDKTLLVLEIDGWHWHGDLEEAAAKPAFTARKIATAHAKYLEGQAMPLPSLMERLRREDAALQRRRRR